jgi:hypothetical protein
MWLTRRNWGHGYLLSRKWTRMLADLQRTDPMVADLPEKNVPNVGDLQRTDIKTLATCRELIQKRWLTCRKLIRTLADLQETEPTLADLQE